MIDINNKIIDINKKLEMYNKSYSIIEFSNINNKDISNINKKCLLDKIYFVNLLLSEKN